MRILSLIFILVLVGCNNSDDKPDVSGIEMNISIQRFDRDFFSLDTNNLVPSLESLNKKYPTFLPTYFEFFSPINFMVYQQGKSYTDAIREYFDNIRPLYESTKERFGGLANVESQLEDKLRYVKYYYPDFKAPAVFTTVESLNPTNPEEIYGAVYYRDTLVISLQMYLGKDFPAYDPTVYFEYLRKRFEPEYMVPNAMRSIAITLYPDTTESGKLLEVMIEKGKQWYLLDKFLPGTHDSLKTGYTGKQVEWLNSNEGNIWGSILQNTPNLYTMDLERVQNYIGEAPRTMDMPEQSPGNIGQWVGWQIVKKFAEKNPDLTVQQILATPSNKIFQEARYKPK